MRNVNDEIVFRDYVGVEKEGIIIDCTPDLKYKVQTKNKIKWIISEKSIISPPLEKESSPDISVEIEKEGVEKSTQEKVEVLKEVQTVVPEKTVVEKKKINKHPLTEEQQIVWDDIKSKGLNKRDLVLYLREKGFTKQQQEKLEFANWSYIYGIYRDLDGVN